MRFYLIFVFVVAAVLGTKIHSESEINIDPGIVWFEALRREGVPVETLGIVFGIDPSVLSPSEPLPLPGTSFPVSPFEWGPHQVVVLLRDSSPIEVPVGPLTLPGGPIPPPPFYPGPELDYLRTAGIDTIRRLREESGSETSYGIAYTVREAAGLSVNEVGWVDDLAAARGPDEAGLATSKALQVQMTDPALASSGFQSVRVAPNAGVNLTNMGFREVMSLESGVLFGGRGQ